MTLGKYLKKDLGGSEIVCIPDSIPDPTPEDVLRLEFAESEVYGPLFDQGYKWRTNSQVRVVNDRYPDADSESKKYEAEGLEVEVCTVAFNMRGNRIDNNYVAIFTRKPGVESEK